MKTYPVTIGVLQFKDKILLLKRGRNRKYSPNLWEFVSGFLKGGESAEEAILREIKEETNLKVKIIKSGKPFEAKDIWGRWIVIPFLISVQSNKVKISREHSQIKWIRPKEISKFKTVVDIKEDLKALGFL